MYGAMQSVKLVQLGSRTNKVNLKKVSSQRSDDYKFILNFNGNKIYKTYCH